MSKLDAIKAELEGRLEKIEDERTKLVEALAALSVPGIETLLDVLRPDLKPGAFITVKREGKPAPLPLKVTPVAQMKNLERDPNTSNKVLAAMPKDQSVNANILHTKSLPDITPMNIRASFKRLLNNGKIVKDKDTDLRGFYRRVS